MVDDVDIDDLAAMDVTVLLCDAAQVAAGKLYVLGGGWTTRPAAPIPMALGVVLRPTVPDTYEVTAALVDADGRPVRVAPGAAPVRFAQRVQVAFGGGHVAGTAASSPIAVAFSPFPMAPGRYEWVVAVDRAVVARSPFTVVA